MGTVNVKVKKPTTVDFNVALCIIPLLLGDRYNFGDVAREGCIDYS